MDVYIYCSGVALVKLMSKSTQINQSKVLIVLKAWLFSTIASSVGKMFVSGTHYLVVSASISCSDGLGLAYIVSVAIYILLYPFTGVVFHVLLVHYFASFSSYTE